MNTHTRTGTGIALLVAASLALTACGGDSDSDSNADSKDKIKGAEQSSQSATPNNSLSPSPSDDGIDRPDIKLPEDVKNVFEDSKTGDAKKDAVLADSAHGINAIDEAVTSGKTDRPALRFYLKTDGLMSALQYIQGYYEAGTTFTGTTRYYDRKVTFLENGSAVVNYCSDESKANSKDRKTQKVKEHTPGPLDYGYYTSRLTKNASGVWQTTKVISGDGKEKCQA
ncbi:hypothetical protein [Streptomyces zagrosensis]|uniref:Lipoprotein n=1 Tax=Streptomyces zagrosensis TaxID=1042984 RepID=A0A7W9Q7M4_9ACTN|nr:hypothetical protein [Streptomyces zagrosensis]MBB5934693.1 hypothetical protein [Streptomyces zagrosensis]